MDRTRPLFAARTAFFGVLLLMLLQTARTQICSAPQFVEFEENNKPGTVVANITVEEGVTLTFTDPPSNNTFSLQNDQLIANRVLDTEIDDILDVKITCTPKPGSPESPLPLQIFVEVTDVNDNTPVFSADHYNASVTELSPTGTIVGRFPATDADKPQLLYYRLTPESSGFRLQSVNNPEILVNAVLDYEDVKTVQLVLYVQDTPFGGTVSGPSFNSTTNITVTVLDVDNRPPWFQPCTRQEIGMIVICHGAGYTGTVMLGEQQEGALTLNPGPVYAIDGDSGINAEIQYSLVSDADGLFRIGQSTGNITVQRVVNVTGTITLTVLAAQKSRPEQYALTPVTFTVQNKSGNPPQFQSARYEGIASGVGEMVLDKADQTQPLHILATDADFSVVEGINPFITYKINSTDFTLINGFLFMVRDPPEDTVFMQVVATDASNGDTVTAPLLVHVVPGPTTTTATTSKTGPTTSSKTTAPGPTTISGPPTSSTRPSSTTKGTNPTGTTARPPTGPTTPSATTTKNTATGPTTSSTSKGPNPTGTTNRPPTGPTTPSATTTKNTATGPTTSSTTKGPNPTGTTNRPPTGPTTPSATTTKNTATGPTTSSTTKGPNPTGTTNRPPTGPTTTPSLNTQTTTTPGGGGASPDQPSTAPTVIVPPGSYKPQDMVALGVTLGLLLFICLVVIMLLYFRLRKGSTYWKKIYETSIFRSTLGKGSGGQKGGIQYVNDAFENDEDGDSIDLKKEKPVENEYKLEVNEPHYESVVRSAATLNALLPDNTSLADSDKASEKEVKPILTKERRMDEGYKSVWFKEDIDPNAKEEVVIIPDSREHESEEEDEKDEDNSSLRIKTQRVGFTDSDLDSGVSVKIEDQTVSSDDEGELNIDL